MDNYISGIQKRAFPALLWTPITIGSLTLPNRFVVPAMASQYCSETGEATERYIAYHEAKARGGWGLIITENYAVTSHSGAFVNVAGLWSDDQIPGHRELVNRVHRHGARICCQIYHAGRATHPHVAEGQAVAPSAIKDQTRRDLPRALTQEEIAEIIYHFGRAAARAKACGFDMVEIHGAHGYLITQFLSPFSNKRTDRYGGSLYNRSRFLLEIIAEIRRQVGPEFPVQLRISAEEFVEDGLTLADSRVIAQMAEAAGVNAIHVSQGHHAASQHMIAPYSIPAAAYADNAAAIKAVLHIPVIGVGRINDPLIAESLLVAGKMDLVSMGRASLADPALPLKVRENRWDDIHYCIGCLQGCVGKAGKGGIRCMVNPSLGHEYQMPEAPAARPRRILVAGGGIAGCEAAILAARKGHRVTLYEASHSLGGQWQAACMPPGKSNFLTLLYRQAHELHQLHVSIHLNTPVTPQVLTDTQPDLVLIATGSKPFVPPIQGANLPQVVSAADILLGKVKTGRHIVIVGGGLVGAETAHFAAVQGARVTILEMTDALLRDGEYAASLLLKQALAAHNITIHTKARCTSIQAIERELTVEYEKNDTTQSLSGMDQIILAAGVRSNNDLMELCTEMGLPAVCIGDAASAKNGLYNIWEAYDIVANLDTQKG